MQKNYYSPKDTEFLPMDVATSIATGSGDLDHPGHLEHFSPGQN